MTEWLYVRIYPGTLDKLDLLVPKVLLPAVRAAQEHPGVDRWFFIRYIDYRGPHLRLRFRGTPNEINELWRHLEALLREALPEVAGTEVPPLKRLVPMPRQPEGPRRAEYLLDLYEPEYGKYGGPVGVAIAEELFQASSELAISALKDGILPMHERVGLALPLMAATANAAIPPEQHQAFWDYYTQYWVGTSGEGTLEQRYREAARRRGTLVTNERDAPDVEDRVRLPLGEYRVALANAVAAARRASLPVPIASLCFHYVHLMNNRLGIYPPEEAYLAQLVQAREA